MNHYLLYRMIYWRILEATFSINAITLAIGGGLYQDTKIKWLFFGASILFTIMRFIITSSLRNLEDALNIEE